MKQRKTRSMLIDADDVAVAGGNLVVGEFCDGWRRKQVSIPLDMTTAPYIAEVCLRWIVRKRDEAARALTMLREVDKP